MFSLAWLWTQYALIQEEWINIFKNRIEYWKKGQGWRDVSTWVLARIHYFRLHVSLCLQVLGTSKTWMESCGSKYLQQQNGKVGLGCLSQWLLKMYIEAKARQFQVVIKRYVIKSMHVGKEDKFPWKLQKVKTVPFPIQTCIYSFIQQLCSPLCGPRWNDESGLVALSEKMVPFLSHILSEWSHMAESHFIPVDVCLLTLRLDRLILHRTA